MYSFIDSFLSAEALSIARRLGSALRSAAGKQSRRSRANMDTLSSVSSVCQFDVRRCVSHSHVHSRTRTRTHTHQRSRWWYPFLVKLCLLPFLMYVSINQVLSFVVVSKLILLCVGVSRCVCQLAGRCQPRPQGLERHLQRRPSCLPP